MKQILKPLYKLTHDVLFATTAVNPFVKHTHNNKEVIKGFIGDEHLHNPALDNDLLTQLKLESIQCKEHYLSSAGYQQYMASVEYPHSYYGGAPSEKNNFTEKTLEHYTTLEFINFNEVKTFVDVAACTSPFADIVKQQYNTEQVYKQDLVYAHGIHDNKIGGYAHEIPLPENSVDAITLHCSLEHFEGDSDKAFFSTVNKILKPGGKALILPFYFAHTYTIHIDPAFNFLRGHHPIIDSSADLRYCNWYQFHSRHYDVKTLQQRIISQLPQCNVTLHRVMNFRKIWPKSYLRWVLEIQKY